MITVEIKGRGLASFIVSADALASDKGRSAARMALNDTGRQVTTQVKRALVIQTGVKYGAVSKAMTIKHASNADLEFQINATGKHFGLTDFNARQGAKGVSAAPWNKRRVFVHTFMVGKLGNQVFVRTGKDRFPIKKLYGPSIPREMLRDEVPKVFNRMSATILPKQINRQFARLMPK